MKNSSIKRNAILSSLKTILAILFPLITFPYITRILGTDNVGKINFGNSIVSYFLLIASLGISSYAIREGAALRKNKDEFSKFANQMFTLNMYTTLISYISLLFLLIFAKDISNYRLLIVIQSFSILFTTIGIEWIFSIFEEYFYITFRSFIVQIISLILLFLFVRKSDDYLIYAIITVIAAGGSNIYNLIYSKKYCNLKFVKDLNLRKHITPILILFSNNLAITIYLSSDTTLLGIICGDYEVGIYSVAVKIYTTLKSAINALVIVSLPRLSYYISNGEKENYDNLVKNVYESLIILILPIVTGVILLSDDIVLLFAGRDFLPASSSLKILCLALTFAVVANFYTNCILFPQRKEKILLLATIISAIVNLLLNFIFIPLYKFNGAAFTTLIAEMLICIFVLIFSKKIYKFKINKKSILSSFIGCMFIIIICIFTKRIFSNSVIYIIVSVILSSISYFALLILTKNELARQIFFNVHIKYKKR